MKKYLSLFLAITVFCMTFVSCGGSNTTVSSVKSDEQTSAEDTSSIDESKFTPDEIAFNLSEEAYVNIVNAYEILDDAITDIYEAWKIGIYNKDDVADRGISYLVSEMNLSEDQLVNAIAKFMEVTDLSEYDADLYLWYYANNNNLYSFLVAIVIKHYETSGKFESVEKFMNEAKDKMKSLSAEYSDYEHYPSLKEMFTTTNSLFDFCKEPDGSFEQLKDTVNDYKNKIRDNRNDLDFIFEDAINEFEESIDVSIAGV